MMKNPPHPGELVLHDCIEPLNLTITAAAEALGVSRKALSELINGHSRMSTDMAIRLAKGFGGSAESWLGMQLNYDIAQIRNRERAIKVKRVA